MHILLLLHSVQLGNLIAVAGGALEVQLRRGLLHVLLESFQHQAAAAFQKQDA